MDDNLRPHVKIEALSGRALLSNTQWFILVTFKDNIPQGKVYKQGDSHHTLSMHCGRYIRITSKNTHVHLSKKRWDISNGITDCMHKQTSNQIQQTPK